jgi:hypothetical protein
MFTEKDLCLFRDSIGKLLQQWETKEGLEGATFDHLLNAEEAAHTELVGRVKLKWDPGPCGGCMDHAAMDLSLENALHPKTEQKWLTYKIYIDPISGEFEASFFCTDCNNKVRMVLSDDTSRSFRTG